MSYDKSYSALFNAGSASDQFKHFREITFEADRQTYVHANAWWLAECCRLVYKIDDQLRQCALVQDDVLQLLQKVGASIRDVITHTETSTCVVLLDLSVADKKTVRIAVFCGSNEALDWKMNFQASHEEFPGHGRVHQGFLKSANSISKQLLQIFKAEPRPLLLAGHSLGAALATLMLVNLQSQGISAQGCYSFGSPRIGDKTFVKSLQGLPLYRVVNNCDLVTTIPNSLGNNQYLHSDNAIFFAADGEVAIGLSDEEIQQRQADFLPSIKRYLDEQPILSRIKSLSTDLPENFADHAPVNYAGRIAAQLIS